jgi:MFS family permease
VGIALVLLLSTVSFVSLKGSRVLMTLYAVDLGAGPFEAGMLFAVYGLIPALFVVHAGRIADRIGNRALMYAGFIGFAASLILPALYPSLALLFIASPLIGFTSMIFIVAQQNLVGVLSQPATRTRYFSYYSIGDSLASVGGPVMVGFVIDHFSHATAYHVAAAIAAACLVVFHFGRRHIPARLGVTDAAKRGPATDLLRLPALRNALITNGIIMAGIDFYLVYLPLYARGIGIPASEIGLIVGAYGAAGFVVRMLIPAFTARWGEQAMIAGALAIACIAFLGIPATQNPWLLGTVSFVIGLGLGCGQPLSMILAFAAAPAGRSAEAVAMRMAVSYGSHVVIPPVFGALGALTGLAPVFWTCAMLMAGGAGLNVRASRATRKAEGRSPKPDPTGKAEVGNQKSDPTGKS